MPDDNFSAESFAHLVSKFGLDNVRAVAERMPQAVGIASKPGSLAAARADQIETGMNAAHRLVDDLLIDLADKNHKQAGLVRAILLHEAGFGLPFDPWRQPEPTDGRTFSTVANAAFAVYTQEFGNSAADPQLHLTGYTNEPNGQMSAPPITSVDTCAYAIAARHPFDRTPTFTMADLDQFSTEAQRERFCDLQLNGGYCDYAIWSTSTVLPIVRFDVIVFVATCGRCLKEYLETNAKAG